MSLADVIARLEGELLDPANRADRTFITRILADEFTEIGQSGRRYDKESVVEALTADPGISGPRTIVDFEAREIGADLVLAIYRIAETGTLRSSLWRRTGQAWQMIFHQGTPAGS